MIKAFINRFAQKINHFITIENIPVFIVGVSGGADSIALLESFFEFSKIKRIKIVAAHLNYHLRGEESDEDQEFITNFCFDRNIPLVVKSARLSLEESNLENKAREIRMNFFEKLQNDYKATRIALGHHKNDQTETVLFRFFRGSGIAGLRGILEDTGRIIHPFLDFSRREIEEFLIEKKISWRIDKTNEHNDYSRNKLRNLMIPWVKQNINNQIADHLSATAKMMTDAEDVFTDIADKRFKKLILKQNEELIRFNLTKLLSLKKIIRFYIFRKAFNMLTNDVKDLYQAHIESIENIMNSKGSKSIIISKNIVILKEYDYLTFAVKKEKVKRDELLILENVKPKVIFNNLKISLRKLRSNKNDKFDKRKVLLDLDKVIFPLEFRYRKPGDKFIPKGMKHRKKVKDFFIDEKISKFDRDKILIVTDQEKILWLDGLRADQRSLPNNETKRFLEISCSQNDKCKKRAAKLKKNKQ